MTAVRFDFANGWSASLMIQAGGDSETPMVASVVALAGSEAAKPELVEALASADLVVRALAQVARRRPANVRQPAEPIDVDAFARAIAMIPPRAIAAAVTAAGER